MDETILYQQLARITGDTINTIRSLGFQCLDPADEETTFDPTPISPAVAAAPVCLPALGTLPDVSQDAIERFRVAA